MQMVENESYTSSTKYASFMPWLVCFMASLFFFYEFIQGNMFASIADDVMRDFHIQADKMVYLSSIYYVSNVIFLFIAGFMLDRFSAKKTILIAMLLCVLSTFILADSNSFYVALLCRFFTGIGSAFCFLGPIRIASRWFPAKRMALVTGAIVTMAMTGGMVAQYPLTKLVIHIGWRSALVYVGWLGAIMWFGMLFGVKEQPQHVSKVKNKHLSVLKSAKLAYLNPQTMGAALYTSLMNMSVAVFGAVMGSLYLMQRLNISREEAALVNSMLFFGAIIGGPVIGWCSDKLALRILPMKCGVIASLVIVCCILYAPVSLNMMTFLFFALGFCTAAQVISYALVAESSLPVMTAMAVSIVSILTQGGYIVYQNLFGYLLLQHGDMQMINNTPVYSLADYQIAAIILPLGLVVALLVVFKLKETHAKHIM
jgi:MFS family permease